MRRPRTQRPRSSEHWLGALLAAAVLTAAGCDDEKGAHPDADLGLDAHLPRADLGRTPVRDRGVIDPDAMPADALQVESDAMVDARPVDAYVYDSFESFPCDCSPSPTVIGVTHHRLCAVEPGVEPDAQLGGLDDLSPGDGAPSDGAPSDGAPSGDSVVDAGSSDGATVGLDAGADASAADAATVFDLDGSGDTSPSDPLDASHSALSDAAWGAAPDAREDATNEPPEEPCVVDPRPPGAPDGPVSDEICYAVCGPPEAQTGVFCRFVEGTIECTEVWYCSCGRRTAGARPPAARVATDLGQWLADVAGLEALSVVAFENLARALTRHGAPKSLVRGARLAADDERAHTRITQRLAAREGAVIRRWSVVPASQPTLAALALENQVEGCIRETFGAAVAAWQATHATDPVLRRAFARIARDEAKHAALAWRIAEWAEPRLTAAERAANRAAGRQALAELQVFGALPPEASARAGLPDAQAHRRLLKALLPLWNRQRT